MKRTPLITFALGLGIGSSLVTSIQSQNTFSIICCIIQIIGFVLYLQLVDEIDKKRKQKKN